MEFALEKNTPTKPLHKHWQFCVGSGHAGLAMRTDYVKQLKRVHEELGMRRVRFHGIFCDDMHTRHTMRDVIPLPGGRRFTEQSFRLCGLVFDNVMECGMQPFVELGFMPNHLAKKNARGLFFYKPNISPPKSDAAWEAYITDFILYLQRRYGKAEVESWFFEVWNEPDLRIGFFAGTQQDYFHMYEITVRAIKKVNPNLMVGGPATSACKWVVEFLDYCNKRRVPVDFVSTHQYPGDPLGGVSETKENNVLPRLGKIVNPYKGLPDGSVLSAVRHFLVDPQDHKLMPNDRFMKNAEAVQKQASGYPVYFTEWNVSATFGSYTLDTRKAAAYDILACLGVEDFMDGSSLWCFSDIFEELHPFPEEFHGGFGLQTQHGIPKPSYHAMKMLALAGDERYVLPGAMDGDIGMAAFKTDSAIQVLLLRQRMQMLDLPAETANVTVELDAAPSSVTVRRIDSTHGNPLDIWEKMGRTPDLTREEVDSIQSASQVVEEQLPFTYADGKLQFSAQLCCNDVWFVQIGK